MLKLKYIPKLNDGFTLIELLTVVALIGLLASLILVQMGSSRERARDTAIKQTFATLSSKAAYDYSQDGNFGAVCDGAGGLTATGDYFLINESVKKNNGGADVKCYESGDEFAAWTPLREDPGTYWCLDWMLISKELNSEPPNGTTTCP